jgi:two-component system, LuxR family, sensor kinase FixL
MQQAPPLQKPHRESLEQVMLRSALDAIVSMNAEGRVVEFNPAAERTFGFSREAMLGKELAATIISPQFREGYRAALADQLAGASEGAILNRRTELTALRGDGTEFPIELAVTRAEVNGHPLFTAFIRDLSERRNQEDALKAHVAQLAAMTEQLRRKNEELDQFAYIASHDLKAPLRGIANLSQWIEEDMGERFSAEAREQMELLRGRVRRMEALIDGVLQLSRVGRVRTNPEPVRVSDLLGEVVDLLHPPEGFGVEVGADMPTVTAERLRLEQVFMNLINNAIKHHGPPPGRVRISWRDVGGNRFEFAVADDGPGIAPQYHEKIFAVFQALAARDKVEGTGLGLSLVRKIVEDQGGRVWVESEPGRGATFRFTWPKRPVP